MKQDGRINVNPSDFNQRPINSMMKVQGNLALIFMVVLNMDFYIFKVDAHNSSIIITLINPIFLGVHNKPFATLKWVLNDSS